MINNIEHYKEILSVMPRNNVKNDKEFLKKALVIKSEIEGNKNLLLEEIKNRFNSINSVVINPEIEGVKNDINSYSYLYLINEYSTSFEKSNLDRILHDIRKFYLSDLTKLNSNIKDAINVFREVGINLTVNDFRYGNYVYEYMKALLYNEDYSKLKEIFDSIYWKCPDIINYIDINFRCLYIKYENMFDKYYKDKLLSLNISSDYESKYKALNNRLSILEFEDFRSIMDNLLNGNIDIKDYSEDKINKLKDSIYSNIEYFDYDVLFKLYNSLKEYKYYLKFKYIFDEVMSIYKDKEKNKDITKPILKEINKYITIINKSNKKIDFKNKYFGKGSIPKIEDNISLNIVNLKNEINNLDNAEFNEKVCSMLNDNSSIYDLFKFVNSYKLELVRIIKKVKEFEDDELKNEVHAFDNFVNSYMSIINNISIVSDRDIAMMITDKYKLMNIVITPETIDESSIDSFINVIEKVLIGEIISKNSLSYEELLFLVNAKKVIDKN